jgi:hypothetical protein
VDNIIATDHDAHTDLLPTIAALDLSEFVHATVGEEITSFDYGHFNGYPQAVDPTRPSGGSTDWAGAAPPGEDFPSSGNFTLTPGEIASAAEDSPANGAGDGSPDQPHRHSLARSDRQSLPGGLASLLSDAEGSCASAPSHRRELRRQGELFHHFAALDSNDPERRAGAFLDQCIRI